MPPGFGLLDTALVSFPLTLALLGLIRGGPVELASCCGCLASAAVTWIVGATPLVQALGEPTAPILALLSGIAVWHVARSAARWRRLDLHWLDLGRGFDSVAGFVMGAMRGAALAVAGCLAYAIFLVPLGLSDPAQTLVYPRFLNVGARVTGALTASRGAAEANLSVAESGTMDAFRAVPAPALSEAQAARTGTALATLLHAVAPSASAATMLPPQVARTLQPDIPVRQFPVALIETHHNLLHPRGTWLRHGRR